MSSDKCVGIVQCFLLVYCASSYCSPGGTVSLAPRVEHLTCAEHGPETPQNSFGIATQGCQESAEAMDIFKARDNSSRGTNTRSLVRAALRTETGSNNC